MNPPENLKIKQRNLEAILHPLGPVLVAFSGGVDSSFLLASCVEILGSENVLAVVGDSPTLARKELSAGKAFAASLGVSLLVLKTGELEDPLFIKNPVDRCYYCKRDLFSRLRAIAEERHIRSVLDGTNLDDTAAHRPGRRAAREHGILSPLAEAGLTKQDVRELSREMGLATWNKPAMACLASRFPHGDPITVEGLGRIERAEAVLKEMGFRNVRVRDHSGLARIEVDRDDIPKLLSTSASSVLLDLGFRYVTVDLEGFRSGSLSPNGESTGEGTAGGRP